VLARLGAAIGATLVPEADGRLRVDGREPDAELVAAMATACADLGLLLGDLTTGGATLEDRYLAVVGRQAMIEPDRERGLRL
jgi:hypothetical protein